MADEEVMEVLCWSGDWGLPTIDIGCLEVLTYAKFAGSPLKLRSCDNPWKSPSWEFPVLKSGQETLMSPVKIIDHLRKKNFNADYQLTAKQGADTLAFISLVHTKLYPAVLYTLWLDSTNYCQFTRPWYAKVLPFPLNYFIPGRIARQAKAWITKGRDEVEDEDLENKVFKDALECLNMLSTHLGEKKFFFGESPTTLDAVVFAHLALLWRVPLPSKKLTNYLHGYDNLCSFCGTILRQYFPEDPSQSQASQNHSTDDPQDVKGEFCNSLFAVGFATAAMVIYAVSIGLIRVPVRNQELDQHTKEDSPDVSAFLFPNGQQNTDDS